MKKDIIWQRFSFLTAPAFGAMVFACALCGVTIWFSKGALGPWLALLGLGLALTALITDRSKSRDLAIGLCFGLGALGLCLFSGGLTSAAASCLLWPVLGIAAIKGRLDSAIAASLSILAVLVIFGSLITFPENQAISIQTGILALGVNGALALAAFATLNARSTQTKDTLNALLSAATTDRDVAIAQANDAQEQTKGRAQFMAEMSHEIRTPLNAILGFADTMREGVFGPIPKAYGDYPDLIHTSGTHLLDLVSDLLDLSKIEAGRYNTDLKIQRLDEIAYEGVRLSSGAARAAGVQIRHEASSAVEIEGDARALRQIVFNLMSNAIKFTPKDGRITLRVLVDPQANMASLEVEDSGMGMSDAALAKIGQAWNQGSEDVANEVVKSRGSGLGLALVKRLTELQHGTFEIASTLGVGTRARVSFACAQRSQTAKPLV